jgi:DNA repair protein RadA/Sms
MARRISPESYPKNRQGDAYEEAKPRDDEDARLWGKMIDAYDLQRLPKVKLSYLPLLGQDGYFVEKWSHVLAGFPRCGKTELLFACIRQWIIAKRRVLLITEESKAIWQARLEQKSVSCEGLNLFFGLGEPIENLLGLLHAADEEIVIVDTARNLGILPPDENDNAGIARSIAPWVAAAREKGKTLIIAHHCRKGGGGHGEGISGGHALIGAVDVALEVGRDTAPNRRTIMAHARIVQPDDLLYERADNGDLTALGDPTKISVQEVGRRAFAVLDTDWIKTSVVLERMENPKPSPEQLRHALLDMAHKGIIERDPSAAIVNVSGKTVRWRRHGTE